MDIKTIIESIFGTYTPVTYDYTDAFGNVFSVIPSGISGIDWSYVLGGILFIICVYATLRIIGGFLK